MTDSSPAEGTSSAPAIPVSRRRFARRQEALTIAWLRSLSRSASASSTTNRPPGASRGGTTTPPGDEHG